ncbi:hypothetical protein ISCGN_010608 [Ixodes scapularis]
MEHDWHLLSARSGTIALPVAILLLRSSVTCANLFQLQLYTATLDGEGLNCPQLHCLGPLAHSAGAAGCIAHAAEHPTLQHECPRCREVQSRSKIGWQALFGEPSKENLCHMALMNYSRPSFFVLALLSYTQSSLGSQSLLFAQCNAEELDFHSTKNIDGNNS